MRDTVTFIAGTTILMEMHPWIPVAIMALGFILDKAKNFFSYVLQEEATDITITQETTDEKHDTQQAGA